MYSLYSVLLLLALVISSPWWLLEMLRHGKYRAGWRERLGTVPDRLLAERPVDAIWIHAVSVGEVLAISRVVEELKTHLPGWRIVVSTTTDTGQKLARERFGAHNVFYFPLDLPFAVRAYLRALQPKLLVLAESEFWPNLLRWANQSGAVVAVLNARVSTARYQVTCDFADCWRAYFKTCSYSWRRARKTRGGWCKWGLRQTASMSPAT